VFAGRAKLEGMILWRRGGLLLGELFPIMWPNAADATNPSSVSSNSAATILGQLGQRVWTREFLGMDREALGRQLPVQRALPSRL
jgi:hypothetical protein